MTLKQPLPTWVGALTALTLAVWVWVSVLSRGYVEIGPDEGMEMAKALLLAKAPAEANRAWSDQPWLYAKVLSWLWQVSGHEWLAGRLFTVLVASAWLLVISRLMPRGCSAIHGLWGGLFLVTWPQFLPLSCSMMVEVPCIGLATLALVPLMGVRRLTLWHCAGSAVLAGVATSLKLVALLALPAWLIAVAQAGQATTHHSGNPAEANHAVVSATRRLIVWSAAFLVVVGCLLPIGPGGPQQWLLLPHLRSERLLWQTGDSLHAFSPSLLLPTASALVSAAVGLALLRKQGRLREAAVPAALLVVPLVVHSFHRPFWSYYLLHFASGAAALGGWGLGEILRQTWQELRRPRVGEATTHFERHLIAGTLLGAAWFSVDVDRSLLDLQRLQGNQRLRESVLVQTLKQAVPRIHHAYSRDSAFLAQANCLAVPKLTITPLKRFWSGDLTETQVLDLVSEQLPEALLLRVDRELGDPAWQRLLTARYTHVVTDRGLALYLHQVDGVTPRRGAGEYLRSLGL